MTGRLGPTAALLGALHLVACGTMVTPDQAELVTGVYDLEVTAVEDTCNPTPLEVEWDVDIPVDDPVCVIPILYNIAFYEPDVPQALGRMNVACEEGFTGESAQRPECEGGSYDHSWRLEVLAAGSGTIEYVIEEEYDGFGDCSGFPVEGDSCRAEYLYTATLQAPCEPPCEFEYLEPLTSPETACSCPDGA
jgi:hypothetical protein